MAFIEVHGPRGRGSYAERLSCSAFGRDRGCLGAGRQGERSSLPGNRSERQQGTANVVVLTTPGDSITGNSQGTSTTVAGATSADYFRVNQPAQAIGVYRNRLVLGAQVNHVGTIRGLGQTPTNSGNSSGPGLPSATALDNALQTTSSTTTPSRFTQWYTFGPAASHYYRVTGATSTTADYSAVYDQVAVTPTALGNFTPGQIEISNTNISSTQDTEIFVYDATTGLPMPGYTNDDFLDGTVTQTGGSTLNSRLVRNYAPGTYLLAISNFNTADAQLSPADEGTASGTFMDFAGVMANSSTTTLASIPFRMIDADSTDSFTAVKAGAFDIAFFTFTVGGGGVVPEPTTLGVLGLAGLGLFARRRRA